MLVNRHRSPYPEKPDRVIEALFPPTMTASLTFRPGNSYSPAMKNVLFAFLLFAMGGALAQLSKPPSYPFDSYPAGKIYKGHPAPAKLVTAEQREFRTVLRNGAKKGPNFAGHFTVVEWGCGSNCIAVAVVDAVTGVVYDQDMPQMNQSGICGAQYKLTSTLFVVETSDKPNGDCRPELYRWVGSHFVEASEP